MFFFCWQAELDSTGYGKDVDSIREAFEIHKRVHEEIIQFQNEIADCAAAKVNSA